MTPEIATAAGATLVAKDELFRQADVVTIHVILSRRTRGLVGAAELALMKPTARLINTSRGPIVDEASLIKALQSRSIAGAALDVFAFAGSTSLPHLVERACDTPCRICR